MTNKRRIPRPKNRNKYGATKTIVGDIKFDSKREAIRWMELQTLAKSGFIADLQRQVKVLLIGQNGPLYTRSGAR